MNIDAAFPSNYLKAADLHGDTVVTITTVSLEQIGDERKPVVYFAEMETGLVLNKTNKETIKAVLGTPDTDHWVGKQITLFPTQVDFQGRQVEAIRIRLRSNLSHDPVTDFWAEATKRGLSKKDAAFFIAEAEGDFVKALALLRENK
jgi:hypothetical protein